MPITNKFGFAQCWVKALSQDTYVPAGWRSITGLIKPPQVAILYERHKEHITQDVRDLVWNLLGHAVHAVLELAEDDEAITEKRFEFPFMGRSISLQPDRIEPLDASSLLQAELEAIYATFPEARTAEQLWGIKDFKITKCWAAMHAGDKEEWTIQGSLYAYALRKLGWCVVKFDNELLLKDWDEREMIAKPEYPRAEIMSIPQYIWDDAKCAQWLTERVTLFTEAEKLPDEKLPECSIEERWADPDKWAVVNANGNACRGGIFENEAEAKLFYDGRKDKSECQIEFRPGVSKRCERYCAAKPFCCQYNERIKPAF